MQNRERQDRQTTKTQRTPIPGSATLRLGALQALCPAGRAESLKSARKQNEDRADNFDLALKWLLAGVVVVAVELVLVVVAHIS